MKGNYSTSIVGDAVRLIPYRKHHVSRYHKWMCSPELLEATASEPLSLKEEYEMQVSWRDDDKKVTFIVLDATPKGDSKDDDVNDDEASRMLGDVNLFLNDRDDPYNAEIEIMIAEKQSRRKGFAREALRLMMAYGVESLNLTRFYAKIGKDNSASLALFKSMGYVEVNYVEAFQEYELELKCEDWRAVTCGHSGVKCAYALPAGVEEEEEYEE